MDDFEPKLAKFDFSPYNGPWVGPYGNDRLWELLIMFDMFSLDDPEISERKLLDKDELK